MTDVIKKLAENGNIAGIGKDFKPQLYNIWNFADILTKIMQNGNIAKTAKDFKPQLYNIRIRKSG